MKRMLSGIKPSGQLTLGNYIGALREFVKYQNDYEMIVFIANLHTLTVYQDPKELSQNLKDTIALYLACGLDPNRSTIFMQSDVMEHAQLGFILSCNTYMGELNRMTQYKDKLAKGEESMTSGFYVYPTLMASDILIYDPDFVPVGEDQKQHVELTRDVAMRFNNRYGETFKIPQPLIPKIGARIMSLSDPTKKMSKSDEQDKGCIYLLDKPEVARKKVMSAITDLVGKVQYDPINQPGIANLLVIHSALSGRSIENLVKEFEGQGYGTFKKAVADEVVKLLIDLQAKYNDILNQHILDKVLAQGAVKARVLAHQKLKLVETKIGLTID
ncbi:MAG: tryptophanyl-tRNA synthetase [Erysipelotrichaceae bacterium]|nr:MAG: tryptophanyl-tRNA [Erysipelotrichaceae bacterium]TXT17287.1 MAG: tryptophanyl-tRNA synthetase [Erysipelotrichaceae bacterium]